MTQTSAPAATLTRCCTTTCTAGATHTVTWDDGDYAHLCFDCAWDAYHGTNGYDGHGSSMTTGIVGDAI
jgi:hypothetical protein